MSTEKGKREAKDSYIRFRCTVEEKAAIEAAAKRMHLSMSAYILYKLLGE